MGETNCQNIRQVLSKYLTFQNKINMNKIVNTYIPLVYELWHSYGYIIQRKNKLNRLKVLFLT